LITMTSIPDNSNLFSFSSFQLISLTESCASDIIRRVHVG